MSPRSEWVIPLPWDVPPVKPNGGYGSIYGHAAKVKQARTAMGLLARKANIPPLTKCRVQLTWYVPDKIRRDVDNLAWTLKPLCDALAGTKPMDWKIVDDDTPEFMEKLMPDIVYRPGQRKELVVTITALEEENGSTI